VFVLARGHDHTGTIMLSLLLQFDLDPVTFMYKFDPYALKMYLQKNELSRSGLSEVITLHATRFDRNCYDAASRVVIIITTAATTHFYPTVRL